MMARTEEQRAHQRRYAKRYEEKRIADGFTKHVIWLSADATEALNKLSDGVVPKELIINTAIIDAAKQK